MFYCGLEWPSFKGNEMTVRITRVHRGGRVFFAATIRGVYLERTSLAELREAIAVRESFLKIFAESVDAAS